MKAQIQAARRARRGIEQVRKQLLCPTPESVSACAAPLTEAIHCMEMLQTDLRSAASSHRAGDRELSVEVLRLRTELAHANALLRSAAQYYEGYGRLLRSQEDTGMVYSRVGTIVSPSDTRKLIVHG